MTWKKKLLSWKYAFILLGGIGVSNIGEWVYFIALNLIVLDMTGSPLAVSILYVIKPLAALSTNFWAGTIIDRLNKRKLMIFLDVFRAIFIAALPFMPNLIFIYLIVFFINMGHTIFVSASMTYITKLIPVNRRKRFNSLHSLVTSGGFLIGPGVAGLLFIVGNPTFAIYVNAIALLLSAGITLLIPNVEKHNKAEVMSHPITRKAIVEDWKEVVTFSRSHRYIMIVYFLFSCVMVVMASAIDSLEAAFAKQVLGLSNTEYGLLVSIAGAGIVVGAISNTILVTNWRTSSLIGWGTVLVTSGYVVYAFASSFVFAAIGFFVLAFFLAYANTGYLTFYQNNIPVHIMGRVDSIYRLIEAGLIIIGTCVMGATAHFFSIQLTVVLGVFLMMVLSFILLGYCFSSAKKQYALSKSIRL